MQMRIHGLRYETEASVQVNGSAWVPLNSATVTLLGNAAAYGGIGGGFGTLDMTVPLPSGAIVVGNNTINFRFNGTDGRTSGFRVLSFNFLDPHGNALVPSPAFVQDDPSTWQPPSTNAADIAAGQALWRGAALTAPKPTGPVPIQAKCSSCHAQDGRDLKYFNYSNYSIRARSVFHGLTAQQGDQIASYIRTLAVNNPGRPWNPPYQPGPGLDSKPVSEWSAGAGLDAVANSDQDQLNDIFSAGIQDSVFSAQGHLEPARDPGHVSDDGLERVASVRASDRRFWRRLRE
jgi:cytochrome c553